MSVVFAMLIIASKVKAPSAPVTSLTGMLIPSNPEPWPAEESLPSSVHDIWCRADSTDSWRFQAMIDEADNDSWCSRRDPSIRMPLSAITRTTTEGIPYLAPAVQLFYKARQPRSKDQVDFAKITSFKQTLLTPWWI